MEANIENLLQTLDEYENIYTDYTVFLEDLLQNLIEEKQIHYQMIKGRTKSKASLEQKLRRSKNKYQSLLDVTDIVAVRVVTYFASDINEIASLIEKEFKVDKENSVDKRAQLDVTQFGYVSMHYVVELPIHKIKCKEHESFQGMKAEIQICSMLQHAWAEIEHDLGYKVDEKEVPNSIRRSFSRIASLLEIADLEFDRIRTIMQDKLNKKE